MPAPSSEPPAEVLVTVGTSLDPFDRLLRLVDELCAPGGPLAGLPVFAQSGACRYAPLRFGTVPFLPAPALEARIRAARVVLCHGGAGTIGTCLALGKRPVVVPRRAAQGEIVNDHQLELCRRMADEGRIYLAEDGAALAAAVRAALAAKEEAAPRGGGDRLRAEIGRLLSTIAARPR
jgi:UDP-N-acetylglucosamine transferase subunit ALG13